MHATAIANSIPRYATSQRQAEKTAKMASKGAEDVQKLAFCKYEPESEILFFAEQFELIWGLTNRWR